ncbi:CopD family protein [Georgenia sp. MJ170]|uniref:CopD family protein n=1 Tax=Georgenia sunbinii TaxID=3117728 RepID=UPI002F25F09E
MTVQRLRRTALVLVAAMAGVLLTFLSAAPATGHAMLIGTDPADGDVLPAPPAVITLMFNEPVQVSPDGVRLLDASGEALPSGATAIGEDVELEAPADLAHGSYIVDWRVTSADGHPISGAFTFSVGQPSESHVELPDEGSAVVEGLHRVSQVLVYVGLLGATGLVLFTVLLLDSGAAAVRGRLTQLAAVLGIVAAVGLLATVLVEGAWRTGAGPAGLVDLGLIGDTLTTPTGLATALGLVGLALAVDLARRAARSTPLAWLACGAAVLALVSLALTGHTRSFGPDWLVVGSDVLHVIAGSVWFGGLLGLLITLRATSVPAPSATRTVTRFSTVAAWVVVVLAVSGTLLAWRIMPGLSTLISTGYGFTLIAKVGLVAVIVAIAGWNRFRLVPQVEQADEEATARSRLRRSVTAEALVVVAVLAVTGILVSQSPTEADEVVAAPTEPVSHHEPLGDGMIEAHVQPAVVGDSTVELVLTDADGAPLEPLADPELRLSLPEAGLGPLLPEVTATGPGTYEAVLSMPLAGDWELEVAVRTSTYDSPVVVLPLPVSP